MKLGKIIAVSIVGAIGLLTLTSCTPGDVQYCRGFGVEGTAEYGNCLSYCHQQEAAFNADYAVCSVDADRMYPSSLYDYGHDIHVIGGYGLYGAWPSGYTEHVSPDYQHNAQIDTLRMRIIEPCMQARGWNSGNTWKAGRHAVSVAKPVKSAPVQKLPWQ